MVTVANVVGHLPVWLEMLLRRWQEGPDLELAASFADPSRLFVDVGANAGLYAWAGARRGAQVLAVEPHPTMAARLRRRLPQIEVVEAALSDEVGEATLFVPSTESGEVTTRATLERGVNDGMAQAPVQVAVRTLDELLAGRDRRAGFVKVDVEGHEAEVLSGAVRTLEDERPVLLIEIEWRHHGAAATDLMSWLTDLDYTGRFLLGDELRPLSSFDPDALQSRSALKAPGAGLRPRTYVNNFLFIHDDDDWARERLGSFWGATD